MRSSNGLARLGVLGVALALSWAAPPAWACDAPGVSCSSEAAPPAAQAPAPGERCEPSQAPSQAPPLPTPRTRRMPVSLNPNGYNQRGPDAEALAHVLRDLEREQARARSEASR